MYRQDGVPNKVAIKYSLGQAVIQLKINHKILDIIFMSSLLRVIFSNETFGTAMASSIISLNSDCQTAT